MLFPHHHQMARLRIARHLLHFQLNNILYDMFSLENFSPWGFASNAVAAKQLSALTKRHWKIIAAC